MTARRHAPVPRILAALALGALLLSGCGTGGIESTADSSTGSLEPGIAETSPELGTGSASEAEDSTGSAGTWEPAIIVSASLSLDVADPETVLATASRIVTDAGGSVASSTLWMSGSTPSAWASLKIPADSFDTVRDEIAELGSVTEESTDSLDVGAEVADIDARIDALEASIGRLNELIDTAETTADLIEAERELTERQADLDGLRAQRSWYADRIDYSTLELHLRSTTIVPTASTPAWERSWRTFIDGLDLIGYALIMLAPWLLLLGAILGLLLAIRRSLAKRRAARRAEASGNTLEEGDAPEKTDATPEDEERAHD